MTFSVTVANSQIFLALGKMPFIAGPLYEVCSLLFLSLPITFEDTESDCLHSYIVHTNISPSSAAGAFANSQVIFTLGEIPLRAINISVVFCCPIHHFGG